LENLKIFLSRLIMTTYEKRVLEDRLKTIDHIQARRFSKLSGVALGIAMEGITRHLRACDRMEVRPDMPAIREIIDDALNGRRVFAEPAEVRHVA
jgi:hypothetical protein